MKQSHTKNLVLTAFCIALCIVLPMAFHAIGAGATFLPMHIPVLLCGLLCGWPFGAARLDWPAAFLPADGNAACLPNPASHDAGTMRIWRVDRAVLPKAEGKPLSLPDWRDAGGARGIRHCKRCAARHCRQALWIYRFFNLSVRHGFAWHCDPTCGGSPSGSGAAKGGIGAAAAESVHG